MTTPRTAEIDGATVGWTDTGTGAPTLLVHAGGVGGWFAPLAERLPGRVIRMLRAGYTGGAPPTGPLDVADHARHAATLLETLDAAPATVVAHSSGSVVALQLALDRPDLVAGLVLCEPPLIDPLLDPADRAAVHAAIGPVFGAAFAAVGRGDVPAALDIFMTAICGPHYGAVFADTLGPEGLRHAESDAASFFADEVPALNRWTPGDLARVTAPVVLVQGGASPGPTHRLVAHVAATLPDTRVVTIPGANHLLPLTHPDELAEVVAAPVRCGV